MARDLPRPPKSTGTRRKRSIIGGTALWLGVVLCLTGLVPSGQAANAVRNDTPSGLPVPRFVSVKVPRANVREGPSADHAVRWIFVRAAVPVEVIAEHDVWRRIRDIDGADGWIHANLLDGTRTAVVQGEDLIALRRKPETDARPVAWVEPGVIARIRSCDATWCELALDDVRGWVEHTALWGVYPSEIIQ